MLNERKYIYLEKIMKKVPINANAGTYSWKIGDTSSGISEETERLLVYALYVGHPDYNFFELARLNLPKKVFGDSSPEVIRSSFKDDHPLIELIDYDYSMVDEFADPVQGMCIYSDKKQSFWITLEDEKVLLSRLKDVTPWNNCKSYLRNIPARYAMTFDDETIETALSCFLCQHGIDPIGIKRKDGDYYNSVKKANDPYKLEAVRTKNNDGKIKFTKRMIPAAIIYPILMLWAAGIWALTFTDGYNHGAGWGLLLLLFSIAAAAIRDESGIFMIKGWYISIIIFYIGSIIASIAGIIVEGQGELVSYIALVLSGCCLLAILGFNTDGRHLYYYDDDSDRWRRMNGKG